MLTQNSYSYIFLISLHKEIYKVKINFYYDECHGNPQMSLMSKVTLLEVTTPYPGARDNSGAAAETPVNYTWEEVS